MMSMRFRADTAWAILEFVSGSHRAWRDQANVLCGEGAVVHEEKVNIGDWSR